MKTIVLRRLGRTDEALAFIENSLAIDRFNFGCRFEKYLISAAETDKKFLMSSMRDEAHNYEELALDYATAGCWKEALAVADLAINASVSCATLLYYYKAWFLLELSWNEAILALQAVIRFAQKTPRAYYYLGNLWYDKRQYAEAIEAWENSIRQDDTFPTALRNLSLAYFNKLNRPEQALHLLERAFELDPSDARILLELDQLYKRLNRPHAERLAFLEANRTVAFTRDDLYLEYATLLNQIGKYEEAFK